MSKQTKLEKIFSDFVAEDDKNRDKVSYDVGKAIRKAIQRIQKLRLKNFFDSSDSRNFQERGKIMAKNKLCKDCPYFFNGTYEGSCERGLEMCEKRAKEKKNDTRK